VREAAGTLGLDAAVMTFEPHPREFFAQLAGTPKAPARIANLRDKLQSLADNGIDRVIVEHFVALRRPLAAGLHREVLVKACT
jgi:riboflavin kinase/FMN adenylyltransferase